MKQSINLCKIANLYITPFLPLKKNKYERKKKKGNAFCSKKEGKNVQEQKKCICPAREMRHCWAFF